MQAKNKLFTLLLLLFSHSLCWGQAHSFRYKREIAGAEQGWYSIPLPNNIFGQLSEHLSDIRVWGISAAGDTLEMPYLLKVGAEKTDFQKIPFQLINQTKNKQGYFYTLEVPRAAALNEVKLQFGNPNFDWRVVLEGSHNQKEWFTVLDDYRIVSIENDYTDYSFTTLRFPTIRYPYLRLQIKSEQQPELMPVSLYKKKEKQASYQQYPVLNFSKEERKKEKQTLADIELAQPVPVSQLSLTIADTIDYYRPISILYPADSTKTEQGWRYHYRPLYKGTLSSMEEASFSFPAVITRRLRVQIDNGNNLPLQLRSARAQGYYYSLTTRLSAATNYLLVYGKPDAPMPVYDISLFSSNIPDSLTALQLGPEEVLHPENLTATSPLFSNKLWLWAIMLVLILIMGWFTLKMMKSAQTEKQI